MKKLLTQVALVVFIAFTTGCALFRPSTPVPPQVAEYVARVQQAVVLAQNGEQTAEAVENLLVLQKVVTAAQDAQFKAGIKVADAVFAKATDELKAATTITEAQSAAAAIRATLVEVGAQAPNPKVKQAVDNILAFYDVFVAIS